VLYVPVGARTDYRNAFGWSAFGTILEAGEAPKLSVSPLSLSFAESGGSQTVKVASNVAWTTSALPSWLTRASAAGLNDTTLVTFTAAANGGATVRNATVVFSGTAGASSQNLAVTQAANAPALSVSTTSLSYAAAGSSQNITVTANVGWTAGSSAAWATVSPASGSGNGTVSVTAAANTGAARTATVTLTGSGLTRTVSITQAAAGTPPSTNSLTVSPDTLDFAVAGASENVSVSANLSWTAVSSATWATVSPASGFANGTVSVTAAANTGAARTATVTLAGGGITRTVTVRQASALPDSSLTVSPDSLDFAAAGASKNVSVTANVGWTAAGSGTWVTVSPASGSGNGTVSVTAAANTGAARTATVTLTGGGITRTVGIAQEAAAAVVPPTLSVSAPLLHFITGGGTQTATVTSNTNWTDSTSAPWITVSHSGNVLTVAAEHNTGYAREGSVTVTAGSLTRTIRVTQDAAQQIIVEPTRTTDNGGAIEVAFEIPLDEQFSVTFTITLPAGFVLDQNATSLVSELLSSYQMAITSAGDNGWLFTVTPALSLRSDDGAVYRQLVNIVYTTGESVKDGKYEVKLQDVNLTLNGSGTVIHQDEIKVPVRVGSATGNAGPEAVDAFCYSGILFVNTPAAERIDVYSVSGSLLYRAQKASGEATFNIGHLPKGVLIVRGSSGWVRKTVNNE
jgi:hypothetical protein